MQCDNHCSRYYSPPPWWCRHRFLPMQHIYFKNTPRRTNHHPSAQNSCTVKIDQWETMGTFFFSIHNVSQKPQKKTRFYIQGGGRGFRFKRKKKRRKKKRQKTSREGHTNHTSGGWLCVGLDYVQLPHARPCSTSCAPQAATRPPTSRDTQNSWRGVPNRYKVLRPTGKNCRHWPTSPLLLLVPTKLTRARCSTIIGSRTNNAVTGGNHPVEP